MSFSQILKFTAAVCLPAFLSALTFAQPPSTANNKKESQPKVRTMTIPISIFTKEEIRQNQQGEFVEAGDLSIREDGDEQTILSIRSVTNTPLHLAVLIQDDLTSNVNLQLDEIKRFIRRLPADSRVMVAYLRAGSPQIRQKFTTDLERAANTVRIVAGTQAVAPSSPYDGVEDVLNRFDALPTGRRALLLVSDGLDVSNGAAGSSPTQSLSLDQAILKAQRRGVAVYSFYSEASLTQSGNSQLILNGQGSLNRLSEETGGRAFFQGTISPINFEPFFRDLTMALTRQFALTYLSTHMKKGYHKVQVTSSNPQVKIDHPKGYYYRGN